MRGMYGLEYERRRKVDQKGMREERQKEEEKNGDKK